MNELDMRLLARDDPHPVLFDAYSAAARVLSSGQGEALEPALRAFELILLREIGLLPALDAQTLTLGLLEGEARYALVPEAGLIAMGEGDERASLPGDAWAALGEAMLAEDAFGATLREAARSMAELKPMLRTLLHYHCGVTQLRTRQLMIDLQSL